METRRLGQQIADMECDGDQAEEISAQPHCPMVFTRTGSWMLSLSGIMLLTISNLSGVCEGWTPGIPRRGRNRRQRDRSPFPHQALSGASMVLRTCVVNRTTIISVTLIVL